MKITPAKRRANKKWDLANKERKAYINKRSIAKSFVKNLAVNEDLDELLHLIELRRENIRREFENNE
ncbi:hypothetical protein [Liquorilactobacillus hordei]|uniref:hypothetical protein n=1 Tax=Liquorilactobacillus hordei TaxID=468911 RepID=UPI0039E8323A